MTEVSGAIGLHQVDRIEGFVQQRRQNHQEWCSMVNQLNLPIRVYPEAPNTRHAGFAFPMMLDENAPMTRAQLCAELESRGFKLVPSQELILQYNLHLIECLVQVSVENSRLQQQFKNEGSL